MPTTQQCPECGDTFDVRGLPTHRYHKHNVESALLSAPTQNGAGNLARVETTSVAYVPISRLRSRGNSENLSRIVSENDRTFVTVDDEPAFELTTV